LNVSFVGQVNIEALRPRTSTDIALLTNAGLSGRIQPDYTAVYDLGNWAIAAFSLDPNWIVLFFIIIVGIGFSCTPSRADLHVTGTFLIAHPGQAAITILTLLLGAAILFCTGWSFERWW
jgi:hypothetical protein